MLDRVLLMLDPSAAVSRVEAGSWYAKLKDGWLCPDMQLRWTIRLN